MHSYVTGATGFIGLALVKALVARGDSVTVVHRPASDTRWLDGLPVRHVLGDVTDPASLAGTMEGVDRVFHVAGAIAYRRAERARGWQVNVVGTQNVLNEAQAAGVNRFIHTSSVAAVGVPSGAQPADETFPFNGDSYDLQYFISKHEGERRVLAAARAGFPAVVVNPATVYGAGDMNFNGGRLVRLAAAGALRRYPPGGMCVCDIDDVVAGHLAAAEQGRIGERYVLGGENLAFREVLALANQTVGRNSERLWPLPGALIRLARPFVVALEGLPLRDLYLARDYLMLADKFLYFSSEKAVRELGYQITPFKVSLERAYAWYREQGLL